MYEDSSFHESLLERSGVSLATQPVYNKRTINAGIENSESIDIYTSYKLLGNSEQLMF